MNREEEIEKAGSEDPENYECFDFNIIDIEIGFIKGAKWADNHPVSPWHKNMDGDLPKKSGRYIVMAQNGFCHTCKYKADSRYWDTVGYQSDIAHWMEIPELPTE